LERENWTWRCAGNSHWRRGVTEPAGIVDAHVHGYTADVAAAPAAWGMAHGEPGWTRCVAPEGRRSIQGWADSDALVADMDVAGVETCVLLGWYWERQETCNLQNAWYLDWIRRHPGRLAGFAGVQPAAGQAAIDGVQRALDAGLCGIGEILAQAQGFSLTDPTWMRIVEIAAHRGVPINLHATDPGADPAAGPPTPLGDYVQLARDFPKATFILAHWGGGLAFRGAEGESDLPKNLYFDTAASPLLYDIGVFRSAIAKVGASQILYGSDYPLILYPKAARVPSFRPFLDEIASVGLGPGDADLIMGGNLRRLLSPGIAPAGQRV
jgi:predicted TIM-barrel fold metal-dependent hydrolase